MRQSLKIAISLLASLLLFAGFAVLAFSGLFNVLQASFFLPRIEKVYTNDVDSLAGIVNQFHEANLALFATAAKKDSVAASFAPQMSDTTLKELSDLKSRLGVFGVRLLGTDGRRLFYSSLDFDVKQRSGTGLSYKNYNEDGSSIPATVVMIEPSAQPKVVIDGAHDWFIYALPVSAAPQGAAARQDGTILFYVTGRDLLGRLATSARVSVDRVALVRRAGVVINFDPAGSASVEDEFVAIWSSLPNAASFAAPLTLADADGTRRGYRVFSARLAAGGAASIVEPNSRFEMTDLMKSLLLATFFFTVFLLLYLLLNLRSDPLDVLRQRVKRFQIQLITDLVESPGGADWGRWRGEMEARKEEITWQIQRGIGRVSRKQKPVIDGYMSKSWAEIIDIISRRTETPPSTAVGAIDISRLESLIQAALQNVNFILPASRAESPKGLQVEELRAEEVTDAVGEAPTVGELAETIDEAETVEEVEAVDEAETVEEAEAVEEAETVEEAEAVEEAETVEEAEAVEEAETVEEAEAVEEAETVEEAPTIGHFATPETEELPVEGTEVDDLAELEIVEEEAVFEESAAVPAVPSEIPLALADRPALRRAESGIADFMEIRIPRVGGEGVTAEEATALPVEVIDTSESLEELEPMKEIQPLPPDPVEQGLDFLPSADEVEREWGEAGEGAAALVNDESRELSPEEPEEAEEAAEAVTPSASEPPREDVEYIEELDSVEEEPESGVAEAPAGVSDTETEEELNALLASGAITTWTIEEIRRLVEEGQSAIVMEDGIFRIKEEMYTAGENAREAHSEGKLREIAQEVVRHEKPDEGDVVPAAVDTAAPEPTFSGIGDLIRDEDTVDLSKVVSRQEEGTAEEILSLDREKTNPLHLKRNGLDYDEFLATYPRSFSHTTQMKSLVEVSRRVAAVSAGLFVKKIQGYAPDLTIGISDKTLKNFRFNNAEPFFKVFLSTRKGVVVEKRPVDVRLLKARIDSDDLRYMKRIMFLPAIFRGQEAYLFFSFPGETGIVMEAMLSKLVVQ